MPNLRNRLLRISVGLPALTCLILSVVALGPAIRARYPEADMGKDTLPTCAWVTTTTEARSELNREKASTHPGLKSIAPQERQAPEKLGSKVGIGQSGKSVVMARRASRSSVIFDLDIGGDLDIITNDFNSEPRKC